jgi:O-antigen/teichoic acid export membrane protein
MGSRLLWRRSATALGIYGSTALGILGSLVVLRVLGPRDAGRFSLVIGTAAFFQLLLELTSDEALVKYGFRYVAQEDWGRFHRLVRLTFSFELAASLLAGAIVAAVGPFADSLFNSSGLQTPTLIAALLPPLQAVESMGAATLILRSRYDVRGAFLTFSMGLRLVAIVIGTRYGVLETVVAVVVAQVVTTVSIVGVGLAALRRFPAARPAPLAADRRPVLAFVLQSTIGTALVSLRSWIAPLALGIVRSPTEVGWFRGAQAPQQGFAALSSPVRLILLTEQTRDWERGKPEVVFAGLRRYVIGTTLLMVVALAPLELAMPWLVRTVLGHKYVPATDAARIVLGAAAIQLILGWTKSFPVTIGRPGLRIVAHGIETAVLLPLIVVFGKLWGVTGAAAAVLASSGVFALVWAVLVLRLRKSPLPARPGPVEVTAT